jgi:hypothetical protein
MALGALVIVDDAGSMTFDQLRSLIEEAERTNSKLLLVAEANVDPPMAVLATNLPWAQQLSQSERPMTTAIDRVERNLANTSGAGRDRKQAAELLQRRRQIVDHYRELIADNDRSREPNDRGRDIRGYGIDR